MRFIETEAISVAGEKSFGGNINKFQQKHSVFIEMEINFFVTHNLRGIAPNEKEL